MVADNLINRRNQQDLEDIKHEDLYKDSFKHELDDVVHNSPIKESMQSCRSNKNTTHFDKMFQSSRERSKMAGKKQSSTHLIQPITTHSDASRHSQKNQGGGKRAVDGGGAETANDGNGVEKEEGGDEEMSSEEQMDIEATAVQLFNNMFIEVFEENKK